MANNKNRVGIGASGAKDDERSNALRQIMSAKLKAEGWDNIKQFMVATKVPFSLETVRRAFNKCEHKNLEASTLAIIMKHLNYTPAEIKSLLTEYTDDDALVSLIGGDYQEFNIYERNLVQAYREIIAKNPEMGEVLADQIDLVGAIIKVKTKQYTDFLRR